MPTPVTSSIGTGGRTYSTWSAWEDATDNNLVTADEVHIGECYNDSEFAEACVMAGATTDATRYRHLTTAAGHSFADHADKLTNPLRYDRSKGVGNSFTGSYNDGALQIFEAHSRASKLQIRTTSGSAQPLRVGNANQVSQLILDGNSASKALISSVDTAGASFTNIAGIRRAASGSAGMCHLYVGGTVQNCTFAVPSGVTVTTNGITTSYGSSLTVRNCAVYGVTNATSGAGITATACYTNASSPPSGWTNTAYDTSTGSGFESITAAGMDLRIKSTSALKDAGSSTGAPAIDIVGTTRSGAIDVGCWEVAAASFDAALMAAMQWRQPLTFGKPLVVAAGQMPPNNLPH